MIWLLIISILLFPLGQLGRVPLYASGVIYLYEVVFVLFICWSSIKYWRNWKEQPYPFLGLMPIVLYVGVLFISLVVSLFSYTPLENTIAILYLLRKLSYLLFIAFCLHGRYLYGFSSLWLRRVIYISLAIVAGTAIVQFIWYPELRNLSYLGWDPHLYRLFGTFLEPAILAAVLGISILFIFYTDKLPTLLRGGIIAVLLVLLVMTFSRGAYLSIFITGLFIVFQRRHLLLFFGFLLFALIIFFLIPKPSGEGVNILRTSTISSRVVDYQTGINLWKEHPILGVGYNHIRAERERPEQEIPDHAAGSFHSSFIILLVTSGVVGLVAFAGFLTRLTNEHAYLQGVILFTGLFSLFDNILLHPFILFWVSVTYLALILPSHKSQKVTG